MSTDATAAVPIHLRRFSALPEAERSNKVRPLSARLATGRWREHREAADFIDTYCSGHGDAIDTLVRALLHYRDHLVDEGLLQLQGAAPQLFPTPPQAPARAASAGTARRGAGKRASGGATARRSRS